MNVENEESDKEILIINPPPIDPEKEIRKQQMLKQQQEVFEWMQSEKTRKTNKQPKQSNPVVINMAAPKKNTEDEEAIIQKMKNNIGQVLKF